MKKHITIDQLNELSNESKQNLRTWWKPTEGDIVDTGEFIESTANEKGEFWISEGKFCSPEWKDRFLPLLSIGQMIEFLDSDILPLTVDHYVYRGKTCGWHII